MAATPLPRCCNTAACWLQEHNRLAAGLLPVGCAFSVPTDFCHIVHQSTGYTSLLPAMRCGKAAADVLVKL